MRQIRVLFHLSQHVSNDGAVIFGDLQHLWPAEHVVEIVFHLVILGKTEQVRGLHLDDVRDSSRSDAHHFEEIKMRVTTGGFKTLNLTQWKTEFSLVPDDRIVDSGKMSDSERLIRIAIVNNDKCKPKKCRLECKRSCPVVRMGQLKIVNRP